MTWLLQCLYQNTVGRSKDIWRTVAHFAPHLACKRILQWAMRPWRASVGQVGFDLGDGLPRLVDLRLADEILFIWEMLA